MRKKMVIGSRKSKLALTQTNWVIEKLKNYYPNIDFEIKEKVTKGDKIIDVTLSKVGGKGLFVSEVEQSLKDGEIDFAVHSMKDVPAILMEDLTIGAIPKRESPFDCLIFANVNCLTELNEGAVIGTSSLRRAAQIKKIRPDVLIKSVRGNIDTRLRKLKEADFDAIILAEAGLSRMDWLDKDTNLNFERLSPEQCLPAVGQGALAVECRENDVDVLTMLQKIHHVETAICVEAERAFLKKLDGGCEIPIAGFANRSQANNEIVMHGLVTSPDGSIWLEDKRTGSNSQKVGEEVAYELLERGAAEIITELRQNG